MANKRTKSPTGMTLITVYVPKGHLTMLDDLVKRGLYPNRSEEIRMAIRDLISDHFRFLTEVYKCK